MESDKSDKITDFSENTIRLEAIVAPVCEVVDKNERESTRQAKQRFLAIFERTGGASVSLTAHHAGVSRDTYYRWMREDENFKGKIDYIQSYILDLVEEVLLIKALGGDGPSVRYILSRRHPKYANRKEEYVYIQSNTQIKSLDQLLAVK